MLAMLHQRWDCEIELLRSYYCRNRRERCRCRSWRNWRRRYRFRSLRRFRLAAALGLHLHGLHEQVGLTQKVTGFLLATNDSNVVQRQRVDCIGNRDLLSAHRPGQSLNATNSGHEHCFANLFGLARHCAFHFKHLFAELAFLFFTHNSLILLYYYNRFNVKLPD
jgi:hypothetical protein